MSLASMFMASSSSGGIALSGSAPAPNFTIEFTFGGPAAEAGWQFRNDGTVYQMYKDSTDTQFQSGVEWHSSPSVDYWIKATANTGDAVTSGTIGTWEKVYGSSSATRTWRWKDTIGGAETVGSIKIEISTANNGNPIVATGYYGGDSESF